jgi:hypothetical protein
MANLPISKIKNKIFLGEYQSIIDPSDFQQILLIEINKKIYKIKTINFLFPSLERSYYYNNTLIFKN